MTARPYKAVAPAGQTTSPAPAVDPLSAILAEQVRDQLWMASATSRRSLQQSIGASEIGSGCERQIGYQHLGVRPTNFPDPLRTLIGTGVHAALEESYRRLDAGCGRFLVEERVTYRGIPGTVDLTDRRRHAVLDWKTSTKRKITDLRRGGPPERYTAQAHVYGAALARSGERIDRVALVFVPLDGELADIYVWSAPLDTAIADQWVERYERIAARAEGEGVAALTPTPTRLCGWCAHHRPGSTDPSTGCPGATTTSTEETP